MNASSESLADVLARYQIELPDAQVTLLDRYWQLRKQINEKLNLTRHSDYDKFVGRDLVDSLAFAKFLQPGEKILDVGTGGGVPGVVLAIVREDLDVILAESVGKRARAVAQIIAGLELSIPVIHGRAEDALRDQCFDTLVLRAVAPMRKLLEWFRPHWHHFDRLLMLKGPSWVDERVEARHLGLMKNLRLAKLLSYPMPGTDAESVLLEIRQKDSS